MHNTSKEYLEIINEELDRGLIIKSLAAAPGFFMCAAWITYNRLETVFYANWIFSLGIILMILATTRFVLGKLYIKNYINTFLAAKLVKINIILNGCFWCITTILPLIELQFNNFTSGIQVTALVLGLSLSSLVSLTNNLRVAYAYQWIMTLPFCLYLFFLAFSQHNKPALNAGSVILIGVIYMVIQTLEANKQILKNLSSALDLKNSNVQLQKVEEKLKQLNEELESKVAERTIQLSEAKLAAENANLAKSEFLANMSHEIRTPLGAVMGFAELIANDKITVSEKQNYTAAIKRNGELLLNIISDILDLSKIEVGKLNVELQDISLDDILGDSKMLLDFFASEKGIRLTFTMDPKLPKQIRTDPVRLRQILLNIVGNSIKFTEQGSVDVVVKLVPVPDGSSQLAFIVKDTGIGISKEQSTKIFKSFSQADNSMVRKFGGTGLGLILSKRLANLLGGDVILSESSLGKGSTFCITVNPGSIKESKLRKFTTVDKSTSNFKPAVVEKQLENLNILFVDDSVDNQYLIGKVLKLAGAQVETAENGSIALDKAGRKKFDLILLDLQMPVMDGYETVVRLRNQGIKIPIIALTAYALKEVRQHCLDIGFDDFLTKPIDRSLLLEKITYFIKKTNLEVLN